MSVPRGWLPKLTLFGRLSPFSGFFSLGTPTPFTFGRFSCCLVFELLPLLARGSAHVPEFCIPASASVSRRVFPPTGRFTGYYRLPTHFNLHVSSSGQPPAFTHRSINRCGLSRLFSVPSPPCQTSALLLLHFIVRSLSLCLRGGSWCFFSLF